MDSFAIAYKDRVGNVVKEDKVIRVKRSKLKDLILLQQDLLYSFVKHNASVGNVLADDVIWNKIVKLSKLLPVVGEEKLGIDIEAIEDDIVQLTRIFLTQSIDDAGNIIEPETIYKPSLIAELHQLDYFGEVIKQAKKVQQEKENEVVAISQS